MLIRSLSNEAATVPVVGKVRSALQPSTTLWILGSEIGGSAGGGRSPEAPARRGGSPAGETRAAKKARGATGLGFSSTVRRATSTGGRPPPGAGLYPSDWY